MTDWRRNTEMRQYQIRITELAEENLENAGDYIAYELKNMLKKLLVANII